MKSRGLAAKIFLLPCSKLYGAATYMRNKFFDWNLLKEVEFDVPTIAVGNIAVGGTGKTPLVEYIIEHCLNRGMRVASLSRGYRRKTSGFVMAGRHSTPSDIGDESFQVYNKFEGKVVVAVCEDRVSGIKELTRIDPKIDIIILDDAFQHRYVKPTISIVVSEYSRPIYEDSMLPYGRLREPRRGINRADMLVISKCPRQLTPWAFRDEINKYGLQPYQYMFFSRFAYLPLQPVFPDMVSSVPYLDWLGQGDTLLVVAGIGNPKPFVKQIRAFGVKVKVDVFPDHHQYTKKDLEYILQRYDQMQGNRRFIVTTEKDAVRLTTNPYFPHELKAVTFFLPIKIEFDYSREGPTFEETIDKLLHERTC